ncbi:MAG: 50S ribosomal protein L9 [Candidatus Dependentiae bacterium]|nr:50S ribosomal protein L9 [Candidatus Dependentiae bacterium]
MKIFLLEQVKNVGGAGDIVTVSDGFARNFLLPRKKGMVVTPDNEATFARRLEKIKAREELGNVKKSSLSDRIGSLQIVLRRKMHDDGKLYGAIGGQEIADALSEHGVSIAKNQVVFDKSIKERGVHSVTIKLSASLQPKLAVKVVSNEGGAHE